MTDSTNSLYPKLEIDYDGVTIIGQILVRTKRDIAIEILSPYKGFKDGLHKPYFSNPNSSYLEESGLDYAHSLLLELYKTLNKINPSVPRLKAFFPQLQREIHTIKLIISECEENLKLAKHKLKRKTISSKEYQIEVTQNKKMIDYAESEIDFLKSDFFKTHINFSFNYTLRNDYFLFLQNYIQS